MSRLMPTQATSTLRAISALLLCAGIACAVPTTYVAPSGSHTSPFDTWAKAANNIQAAVDMTDANGTVWVTNGTYATGGDNLFDYGAYSNRVQVTTSNVTVRSVNGRAATYIVGEADPGTGGNGPNAMRCAYLANGSTLRGFTLTNGHTTTDNSPIGDGGGVYVYRNGTVYDCNIRYCTARRRGGGVFMDRGGRFYYGSIMYCGAYAGAGVCITNNGTIFDASVFYGTATNGGGIYIDNGGTVSNTIVSACLANFGGAVFIVVTGTVSRSQIIDNYVYGYGGGLYMHFGGRIANSLVRDNYAGLYGGGLLGYYATIDSCTIVSNTASSVGGGMRLQGGSKVLNSVIFSNMAGSDPEYLAYTDDKFIFCCLKPMPFVSQDGGGNITNAPWFVNPSGNDFRLQSGSPGVDDGTNEAWMVGAHDLDGDARIYNSRVDMGAYELVPEPTVAVILAGTLLVALRRR